MGSRESAAGPHTARRRIAAIARRLDKEHGPIRYRARLDPMDQLVATILSQATSDRNSERAFESLKEAFPHWSAVAAAAPADVEEAIRCGGLARNKARTIQAVLAELESSRGRLAIDDIGDLEVKEALDALCALPGVGRKTAACVLLFAFRRPAMPVDTHVLRLCRRLGLVHERVTADGTHEILQALTPPDLVLPLHVGLILHGRSVCPARSPRCGECVLADLCPVAT